MNKHKIERERERILREAGFDDIESRSGDLRSLPGPAHVRGPEVGLTPEYYEGTAEYYQLAGSFLHSHRFTSVKEKTMWSMHVDGIGYREIARTCKSDTKRVNSIIVKLRTKMLTRDTSPTRHTARSIYREVERMDWSLLLMLAPALLGGK